MQKSFRRLVANMKVLILVALALTGAVANDSKEASAGIPFLPGNLQNIFPFSILIQQIQNLIKAIMSLVRGITGLIPGLGGITGLIPGLGGNKTTAQTAATAAPSATTDDGKATTAAGNETTASENKADETTKASEGASTAAAGSGSTEVKAKRGRHSRHHAVHHGENSKGKYVEEQRIATKPKKGFFF